MKIEDVGLSSSIVNYVKEKALFYALNKYGVQGECFWWPVYGELVGEAEVFYCTLPEKSGSA